MATVQSNNPDQASEQRYRHLFENLPICIFVVDLTETPATLLQINRRTELAYGYTAIELVGKPAALLVPADARPAVQAVLQRVQQGETVTFETTNRRRDGTLFPVRIVSTLDPTDKGRMITAVEDITAEKQRRSEAEAIDAERRRISHEIHDGVAQNLAGLRFKSLLWRHLAENSHPGMHAALEELQTVLIDAIVDLRRAIFALRPVNLEAMGFLPALRQLVFDFGEMNQVAARLELSEPHGTLFPEYELPLYRIIQEGLNNIGQYARASSVLVRLVVDAAGGVALRVHDDGAGFDPGQALPADRVGHFGLRQMRERILDLGGTLDIHSAAGQGTELVISLPPITHQVSHGVD